jgi:hypothetical protein
MTMRASTDPRRTCPRNGSLIVLYGGAYFGPKANEQTKVDSDHEVKIEVLPKAGGKARIQVTQRIGKRPAVVEVWNQKELTFKHRDGTVTA